LPPRKSDRTEKANVHFDRKNPEFQAVIFTLLAAQIFFCKIF